MPVPGGAGSGGDVHVGALDEKVCRMMKKKEFVIKYFNGSYYPVRVVKCEACGTEVEYPDDLCYVCLRKQQGPAPAKSSYSSMPHE